MELTYFGVVALIDDLREENVNLTARIAELNAKNERYIKLIQDWVDVLDPRYPQGDGLASAVSKQCLK